MILFILYKVYIGRMKLIVEDVWCCPSDIYAKVYAIERLFLEFQQSNMIKDISNYFMIIFR